MSTNIPPAGGVPGISGPPDWLSSPPPPSTNTGSYRLDDVRWRGATQRTFGGGASQSASFRAVHATVGTQKYIFLSFRAAFVQALSDQNDMVYLGLLKTGGTKAMVIRMQVHGATFAHSGPPPDSNAPANIASVQISTRTNAAASWTVESMSPTWINNNARTWLQDIGDVPSDPNRRWAIELRIPVTAAADMTDNSGPNLGTDFDMWYVIEGSTSVGPVILADYRIAGTTTTTALTTGNYPNPFAMPKPWDQFLLASGPGTFGGVTLNWGDVFVKNATYGLGTTIANGQPNTFIARPRNYRPDDIDPVTGAHVNTITAGNINATFRIANWGSIAGDPHQVDFATGVWDYVPGNDETTPVNSSLDIPTLPAGNNPPNTDPIALGPVTMTLATGRSLHQCMLVNLSGTNLNFLNDSIFQNMNYDHASLLERPAQISVVGLTPFSSQPRDVYLAIEKVNMPRNTPQGTNEGRFLDSTMKKLIAQGGALAEKLKRAQAILSDTGDYGSSAQLDEILNALRESLAALKYNDPERGHEALDQLIAALRRWLLAVKENEDESRRLAVLFDALADWLLATGIGAAAKLLAFITQFNTWLSSLGDDPATAELALVVASALRAWLSTLVNGRVFAGLIETLEGWLKAGRPLEQLPAILNALREFLASLSTGENDFRITLATFSRGVSGWLRGHERLDALVNVLADVGLDENELDQLFPTVRIHVYHDTGERVTGSDGKSHPVLRAQSSFGLYVYHEGGLDGWQTSLQGATRIADNLYLIAVPNNGTTNVNVRVQGVTPGEERIPEDPIVPVPSGEGSGCCSALASWLDTKGPVGKAAAVLVRFICRWLGQRTT